MKRKKINPNAFCSESRKIQRCRKPTAISSSWAARILLLFCSNLSLPLNIQLEVTPKPKQVPILSPYFTYNTDLLSTYTGQATCYRYIPTVYVE